MGSTLRSTRQYLVGVALVLATAVTCIGYLVGGGQPLRNPAVLTAGLTDWLLVVWLARTVGHGRRLVRTHASAHASARDD